MKIKRNDLILLGGILFLAIISFCLYTAFYHKAGKTVQVSIDGKVTKEFPLNKNTRYTIHSKKNGRNILQIKNGYASISDANCPDQLCVHQKKIHNTGETLVCLPHKVIVSVVSKENSQDTLDGIAQ